MADSGYSKENYIAVVNHTELEKFLNLYYGKRDKLNVGDEVDLGAGYDYAADISRAMRETRSFVKANGKIITAILSGLNITAIDEEAKAKEDKESKKEQPKDKEKKS